MRESILTSIYYSTVTNNGLAQDFKDEVRSSIKTDLIGYFISQICWVIVLWIIKCSILAFYWRLFSSNGRSTRVAIWTIAVAVMCWGIAVVRSPCLI